MNESSKVLDPRLFVRLWQRSRSLREVASRLRKKGHPEMDADLTLIYADVLRKAGTRLKRLPVARPRTAAARLAIRKSPGVRWGFRKAA